MKLITYWKNRLSHPLRGIWYAVRKDSAIQIELIGGIVSLIFLHIFFGPFSGLEQLLLIFCFFLVIITELQNSAIEVALDRLHPERHNEIGISKDLIAGAIVVAALFGVVCTLFIVLGKI